MPSIFLIILTFHRKHIEYLLYTGLLNTILLNMQLFLAILQNTKDFGCVYFRTDFESVEGLEMFEYLTPSLALREIPIKIVFNCISSLLDNYEFH